MEPHSQSLSDVLRWLGLSSYKVDNDVEIIIDGWVKKIREDGDVFCTSFRSKTREALMQQMRELVAQEGNLDLDRRQRRRLSSRASTAAGRARMEFREERFKAAYRFHRYVERDLKRITEKFRKPLTQGDKVVTHEKQVLEPSKVAESWEAGHNGGEECTLSSATYCAGCGKFHDVVSEKLGCCEWECLPGFAEYAEGARALLNSDDVESFNPVA